MLFGLTIFLSAGIVCATTENQPVTTSIGNQSSDSYSATNSVLKNSSKQSTNSIKQNNQSQINKTKTTYKAAAGEVKSPVKFTNRQVIVAALSVKKYVDINHKLPNYVTINGYKVNMYSFYYLLSFVVQNLNTKNNNPVPLRSFSGPQVYKDNIYSGNMPKSEYIHIADVTKVYMDKTGVVPGYAYNTSLGKYLGYKSLIYTYCSILKTYSTKQALPSYVAVKPWIIISKPYLATFTNSQVIAGAVWFKKYVDTNHKFPGSITIGGRTISKYAFYYLLTVVVQNVYNKNNNPVTSWSFGAPQSMNEAIHSGSIKLSKYISIADATKVYMDKTGLVPGYASNTGLGPYLNYQHLMYFYCQVLDSYNTKKVLPGSVVVKPWSSFSVNQIASAAVSVKKYVETNKRLPSYVIIGGLKVEMPSFLHLLTTAVQNIKNKNNNKILNNYCNTPQTSKDSMKVGIMYKSEYITISDKVKVYIDKNWMAPGYCSTTSLGTYFGYSNMIYTYSKIMAHYIQKGYLPTCVGLQPQTHMIRAVFGNVPSDLIPYTLPTSNCQSDNSAIMKLAQSLASGTTSTWTAGSKIMNWVRDNINYSFYYNTKYGALGTLNGRQANCCDHAHLLVALARAVGIPARYSHGNCQFSSGSWYGHVWAQLYINGSWRNADATSTRNSLGVINSWNTGTYSLKGIYRELPF